MPEIKKEREKMSKDRVTRRQKNIPRVLREKQQIHKNRLEAFKTKWKKLPEKKPE
ncbi:MAG: hypothetical protein V1933_07740 [Candidatus Omnitrophota bacterium]